VRRFRAAAESHAATRRRLFEALARGYAIVERSRRTIHTSEALMAEAAAQFGPRSSRDPLLHPLGAGEQIR
jgi:hypothetical protein